MDTGSRRIRKTTSRLADKVELMTAEIISTLKIDGQSLTLFDIRATGDLILDVTFENRKSSMKLASIPDATSRLGSSASAAVFKNTTTPNDRFLYRVRLDTLKKISKYFELLLGSDKFSEGKEISVAFGSLKTRDIVPSEAAPQELPRVSITDDDDTTFMAGRDIVFGDLMRILHGSEVTTRFTIPYLTALAIMADRFDCALAVGTYIKTRPKRFPWPQTYGNMTQATEELLRQKILIAWLLDDRSRLATATKELILRGSSRWIRTEEQKEPQGIWWDLQDGIEAELQHRRNCILSTLGSLQGHFIAMYSSKAQQCKLGYDSSPACDSYQLGEMIKFFMNKGLLSVTSPLLMYEYPEAYKEDVETIITKLRQCPTYQIDKNHAHCGLRTRIIPALDYVQAMLTSNIGVDRQGWKSDWRNDSWEAAERQEPFKFTRSMAVDTRLKMEGYLMPGKPAKTLFTASEWDWSPEV